MKKTTKLFFLLTSFAVCVESAIYAQTVHKKYCDGKIIFELETGSVIPMAADERGSVNFREVPFLSSLTAKYGITRVFQKYPSCHDRALRNAYEVEFRNFQLTEELTQELKRFSFVCFAEKKVLPHCSGGSIVTPNDPYYTNGPAGSGSMWHLRKIKADSAWSISEGSPAAIVAVIDGAIYTLHPDLAANIVAGYDVADGDNDPNPPSSTSEWDHGTMVSGVLSAVTNNHVGIASIGYNLKIMPIKASHDSSNDPEGVEFGYDGVVWAAEHGARVITMSWGGPDSTLLGSQVIHYAYSLGCTLVASAGNDGLNGNPVSYPAYFQNVIGVAATDTNDVLAVYSTHNSHVLISAPGGVGQGFSGSNNGNNILTLCTNHNGMFTGTPLYDDQSGTSFSAPLVAGVCGLMLSVNPSLTPDQIANCLASSADNIRSQNAGNSGYGTGRLNAYAALKCASEISTPPVAGFSANPQGINPGNSVMFNDTSYNNPVAWSWRFPGGNPATSTTQNPVVKYNATGCYAVTLIVSNPWGKDSTTRGCYISVVSASITSSSDTLANSNIATTSDLSFNSVGNGWGYVTGTNNYGDRGNAEIFSSPPPGGSKISGLGILFAIADAEYSTDSVYFRIWDGTGGTPGKILASKAVNIKTVITPTTSKFKDYVYVNFDSPVPVANGYFAGVQYTETGVVPDLNGDTIGVVANTSGATPSPGTAWFLTDRGWHLLSQIFTGYYVSQCIRPVVCAEEAPLLGINEIQSSDFDIFPNPTSGEVNFKFYSTGNNDKTTVSVFNSLGVRISKTDQISVSSGIVQLDLVNESPGIYFIECRTEAGASVRKIILTR